MLKRIVNNRASQALLHLWTRLWVWPQMGIGLKMTLLVIVGVISLIALFDYMGTAALNENIRHSLEERVVVAQTVARHIDYILANIENALTDAAKLEGLRDPAQRDAALRAAYDRLGFFGKRVLLLDRDGMVVASYPPLGSALSVGEAESVQKVLHGQDFAVCPRAHAAGDTTESVLAVAAVRDARGNVMGALALPIDFYSPNLEAFTHPVGLGGSGYLDLVDTDGLILASTQVERVGSPSDHETTLTRMIQAGETHVSRCHNCHDVAGDAEPRREMLAFAPVTRAQWGVTVRQDEQEVLATSNELQLRIFALGTLALVGALVLVFLTTRSVIRPVQALTTAARRMALIDLDTPIPAEGRDEIGVLSRAFDAMRSRLKDSMAEIRALNRQLDARVQERTAALAAAQREAQESRDHLQTIIDSLGDELVVIDRDFRVVRVNAVVERRHGDGVSLIGQTCYEVTHGGVPCRPPDCECPLRAVFRNGKARRVMHRLSEPGGARYMEVIASPLFGSDGQINGVVELMRDVTEEKRLAAQRVELLRRVLSAQEDERKRIARELHDETSQTLTALLYALDTAAPTAATPEALGLIEKTRQLTQSASDGVHKIMFALRPRMLDQLGLVAAVRLYAKSRLDELGIQVELTETGRPRRLNSSAETELFRTLQEAINNIARHADAHKVQLAFDFQEDALEISVQDDGIGFDVEQVPAATDGRRGLGLISMEERVSIVGGEFSLTSLPGQGTTIHIRVPIKENGDDANSFESNDSSAGR